jgi:hypothetical protein
MKKEENIILKVAYSTLSESKKRESKWFNSICRKSVEKRKEARQINLQFITPLSEENYATECKWIMQSEK